MQCHQVMPLEHIDKGSTFHTLANFQAYKLFLLEPLGGELKPIVTQAVFKVMLIEAPATLSIPKIHLLSKAGLTGSIWVIFSPSLIQEN